MGRLGLGRAYVHFGLEHPALFALMFRPDELHPDDPARTAVHVLRLLLSGASAVLELERLELTAGLPSVR